jgi:hypothetical protein
MAAQLILQKRDKSEWFSLVRWKTSYNLSLGKEASTTGQRIVVSRRVGD